MVPEALLSGVEGRRVWHIREISARSASKNMA